MHYGSETYAQGMARMSENLYRRFNATVERGRIEAQKIIEQIDESQPVDRVLPAAALKFVPTGGGVEVMVSGENQPQSIHDHALRQFCQRGSMNLKFARSLTDLASQADASEAKGVSGDWARELIAHNLNQMYENGPGSAGRYLVRSVARNSDALQVRGFLSDKYRRLDSGPLLEAFFKAAIQDMGAVPTRAYALQTKYALRVVLPQVFEPIPNQPMLYGFEWSNSDYGHGKHSLRAFIHQPFCTNEQTRDDVMSQTHVGKRLSEDMSYSAETYRLDQATSASALKDTVRQLLAPKAVQDTMDTIAQAYEEKIDPKKIPQMLKALRKGEQEQVKEAFTSVDIENMSPGQNRWRLSNAISFVATTTEDRYRALELERMSGKVAGLASRATTIEE